MLPAHPFYLIRHGQSEANAARLTAGGGFDSPLTAKGRQQAQTLSPFLSQLEIKPALIHHSTMIRARDTALILNETLKLGTNENRDLREHEMGDWDGQPWDDIEPLIDGGEDPPNGESESRFAQRIQSTLTPILEKTHSGPPMIVAHGGLFHAIGFMYEYGMSEVQNCHLHYFEPYPSFGLFPWRVWQFDVEGATLVKNPAPFCLSQAMAHMA